MDVIYRCGRKTRRRRRIVNWSITEARLSLHRSFFYLSRSLLKAKLVVAVKLSDKYLLYCSASCSVHETQKCDVRKYLTTDIMLGIVP